MPPKAKFTKEDLIKASINIVRNDGFKALTARSLAHELNSSPRPIFTLYENMDEVIKETKDAISNLYNNYVLEGLKADHQFKGTGEAYIKFAIDEPKLFQILFMKETNLNLDGDTVLKTIDPNFQEEIDLITGEYEISSEDAAYLYMHLWIFTHGIATLCATRVCVFTSEQISKLLTEAFEGAINRIKGKQL